MFMRRKLLVFFAAAFLAGCLPDKGGNSLEDLRAWVGKYPTDKINGKEMWDNKALKDAALVILSDKTQKFLFDELGHQVIEPVQIKDDVLYWHVCREHACPMHAAGLFVDLKKKKMHICWRFFKEKEDMWMQTGHDPRPIGDLTCDKHEPYELFAKFAKD